MHRLAFSFVKMIFATSLTACSSPPGMFVDVASTQDLEFVSYSGDRLWYLINTLGCGIAAGDYDGDGDDDLYLLSGHAITDAFQEEANQYSDELWRNNGDGTFTDITDDLGLRRPGWSNGAAFADYDGDGDLDLYVTRHGPNLLYCNRGDGTFAEVAAQAGVDDDGYGTGVAFADLDGDRDLDLYVGNYAHFVIAEQKGTVRWFTDGIYQFPQYFEPQDNVCYRNNGDGTFTDVTKELDLAGRGRALGVLATDYDDDGDMDIFVANDVGFNELWENDGGQFVEAGLVAGVACNSEGRFEASMGVDGADFDNDGDIDLIVTNYGGELNTTYRNEGDGLFIDATHEIQLSGQHVLDYVGWGVGFHDFDNDGQLDLLVVNGHVVYNAVAAVMKVVHDPQKDIPQMHEEAFNAGADQPMLFFMGEKGGKFLDVSHSSGSTISRERMGRGAAFADFNLDGALDVAVSNKNQPAEILMNQGGSQGHWLMVDLRAPPPNVFGIGARLQIDRGEETLTRELHAGTSYLSANSLTVHFGLGETIALQTVTVRWGDGTQESFVGLQVDSRHTLEKGKGEPVGADEPTPNVGG